MTYKQFLRVLNMSLPDANKKRISFTLRFSILSVFITLFVTLTLLIAVIRSIAFKNELLYTSYELMSRTSDIILKEIMTGIGPIEAGGYFSANLFRNDLIFADPVKLSDYTYYLVESIPLLQGAYWADEKGNLIYAKEEVDGSITNEIIWRSFPPYYHKKIYHDYNGNVIKEVDVIFKIIDPRERPWYMLAKREGTLAWTDVYSFYPENTLGVSAGTPAYDDKEKKFLGVFGIDMRLDFLSKFINTLQVSKHGFAFIISKKGELIAYPNKEPFTNVIHSHSKLTQVTLANFPLIKQSLDYYQQTQKKGFSLTFKDELYLVTYQSIPVFENYGWLVGVIAPENDFVGHLHKINMITLGLSLLTLLLGIVIISTVVTYIVRPIKELVKETEKIKHFELDDQINLTSRIKEVMDLSNAISAMKNGLQQFQRYIPKILVRQLIESGQKLEISGERKQLVVFFSDIKDFTTISEKLDSNALMQQICEYFEALTRIIITQKGTIDKYIGDSIMAFWGAPLPERDASEHAAKAALFCQARIEEMNAAWEKEGKPIFATRIGIHKGEAIVGNLGSSERLTYTALGDTINIANRLEVINKRYKTHIIVSETVYEEIKGKFFFRMLDSVIVKGRTQPIIIYELLGDDLSQIPYDLSAYNAEFTKGFLAFQANKREEAIPCFQRCLAIYPGDRVASLFIERCLE